MRVVLALLTLLWIGLLIAAPAVGAGVPVSAFTYGLGALICHQRPERSFHVASAQLPVCARCMGLYVGAAIGACLAALPLVKLEARPRSPRLLLLLAAAPTALTLGLELLGLASPSNMARAAAALPFGAAVAWAVTLHYE